MHLKPTIFDAAKGESKTFSGGILLEMNGVLPKSNKIIYFDNFEFLITSANDKRMKHIKLIGD
jgi:putative hemolysin